MAPAAGRQIRMTIGELRTRLNDFERALSSTHATETVGTYRRSLNEFERWFLDHRGAFYFREADVWAYREYLVEERGLSLVSVSTYLTALRRFCAYLLSIGVLEANPAAGVRGNSRPSEHTRAILEDDDVRALLQVVEADDSQLGKRDAAIVYLMLFAGLSEIEVSRADIGDLEQTLMGWFLRVQGKGRTAKDQQVPLDDEVMARVRIYLDTRGRIRPEHPLVVSHGHRSDGNRLNTRSIRSRVTGHFDTAGINREELTPHSLTHTAAVLWLKNGMSIEDVRERMRHGTLDTTRIYKRYLEEEA
jgi:integrase/recombinase XerC